MVQLRQTEVKGTLYVSNVSTAGLLMAFYATFWWLWLGIYILQAFAWYRMGRKAGLDYAWIAFIPILQIFVLLGIIRRSPWHALWLLLPVVNVVFSVIWYTRLLRVFGQNPWWLLLWIIPVLNGLFTLVIECYMGFAGNVVYNPNALR
jgi:hypothetical protein